MAKLSKKVKRALFSFSNSHDKSKRAYLRWEKNKTRINKKKFVFLAKDTERKFNKYMKLRYGK